MENRIHNLVLGYTTLVRSEIVLPSPASVAKGFLYFGCLFSMWLVIYPCVVYVYLIIHV